MTKVLLLLLLTPIVAFSHKGHTAKFVFSEVLKAKTLLITIDKNDIQEVSDKDCKKVNFVCYDEYIKNNFSILIDGKSTEIEFQLENSFIKEDEVILFYLIWDSPLNENSNIKIINTCFKDFDHSYNNNIIVNLLGHEKSFRMTKQRTEIEFKLRD